MVTFEITIQRKGPAAWPVVVERSAPGQFLPMRNEGMLLLDLDLLRRQITPLDYGTVLGQALFAGPVRDAFVQALAASGNALRVLLCVEADDLKALHWQRLCGPLDGGWSFLSLQQRTPFSLYLPAVTDRRFPAIGRLDLRALALVASPPGIEQYGLESFDAAETVAAVAKAFGTIHCDFLTETPGAVGPPTLDAFCERIVAERYTLVHVVCHGAVSAQDGETSLFLAAPGGGLDRVTGTRLLQRLGQLDAAAGLPHVVFLASCQTAAPAAEGALGGLAQRLVRELGTPAVVAMSERVTVSTAQALAAGFYTRLAQHGEVDRALAEASAALAERGDVTVPALYSRLGNRALFSQAPDRALTPAEITAGLGQLRALLPERAPVLIPRLDALAATLAAIPTVDPAQLSPAARAERSQVLADLDALCLEVVDLDFRGLALGQPAPPYNATCPFRGLAAFRPEDRSTFFGREALTARLASRLRSERFLALVGGSGCGKSSLALAGIAPALLDQLPAARLLSMTPGREPGRTLDALLAGRTAGAAVLVVDQAEEAFALVQDEAQRRVFFERLASLARPEGEPLYVLLTLRAEFLGDAAAYPELRRLIQAHQELIAPMDAGELRSAMEQQARAVGLRFEADLANTLLDDVAGEPGAMPLLQHALLELWQRRHGRWLRAEEYRAIGGVKQAIAHTADALVAGFDATDQTRAQRLFLRLVRVDEGPDQRDTRRRAALDDLARDEADRAATVALVKRLADARLVVTSVNPLDGRAEVELAHETMITAWGRLQGWIEQDRAGLVVRQRLAEDARTWQRSGRQGDFLYRRAQLEPALRWTTANPHDLAPPEMAFVAASQRQQRVGMVRRFAVVAALIAVPVVTALALMAMFSIGPFSLPQITWTRFEEPTALKTAVTDVAFGLDGIVYAGLTSEISRSLAVSDDGGATWSIHDTPTNELSELAASPTRPGLLYGVTGDARLLRTADNGVTWEELDILTSAEGLDVYEVAVAADETIYAVVGDSDLYASSDGGETWLAIADNSDEPIWNIRWDDGRLLVGRTGGLWEWRAGRGWTALLTDKVLAAVSGVQVGDTWFIAVGDGLVALPEDGAPRRMSDDSILQIAVVPLGEPILVGITNDSIFCWRPEAPALSLIAEKSRFSPSTELGSLGIASGNPNRFWISTDAGLYVGDAEEWLARGGCQD
jgi:hypothetical protein